MHLQQQIDELRLKIPIMGTPGPVLSDEFLQKMKWRNRGNIFGGESPKVLDAEPKETVCGGWIVSEKEFDRIMETSKEPPQKPSKVNIISFPVVKHSDLEKAKGILESSLKIKQYNKRKNIPNKHLDDLINMGGWPDKKPKKRVVEKSTTTETRND